MTIAQKITREKAAAKKRKSPVLFVSELKEEMKKVSWTSKEELNVCTKIVIGATFVLGLGIYFIDLILRSAVQGFTGLARLLG